MSPAVLLVGSLAAKREEIEFHRDRLLAGGVSVELVDVGVFGSGQGRRCIAQ